VQKRPNQFKILFGTWTRGLSKEARIRWGAHRHHLLNTIEPSTCGGDAAFLTHYFDHLLSRTNRSGYLAEGWEAEAETPGRADHGCLRRLIETTPAAAGSSCMARWQYERAPSTGSQWCVGAAKTQ